MSGFSSYSCAICNKNCNSSEQLRIHQAGKTHLRKCGHALSFSDSVNVDCYQPWQFSPRLDSSELTCPTCSEHYSAPELLTHCCKSPPPIDTSSASPFVVVDYTDRLHSKSKPFPSFGKSEFYCSTCDVPLYSQVNFDIHVKGKKHIDKKKQSTGFQEQESKIDCSGLEMLSCSLQGIYVVEGGDDPYKGATFTRAPINTLDRASTTAPITSTTSSSSALFCNVCNLQLNSKSQLVAHMEGKKHRSKSSYCIEKVNNYSPSNLPGPNLAHGNAVNDTPSVKDFVPLNSILCPVCDVPVGIASMRLHEMGRTHIFKSAMANCSKFCKDYLIEDRVFRCCFGNSLPSLLDSFPSFSLSLVKALTQISQCDTDVVLQIPLEGDASIAPVALTVALGLVQENRAAIDKFSEHCFGVWICSKKSAVPRRMEEVRLLSKNITKNPPRLANIVKDTFSMDDRSCGITQHEIAFSTPGGLHNLLESVPNVQRAICVLVFTDVESSVDNDPTERLLNHFVCFGPMHPTTRPRIIFITSGRIPCWPSLKAFSAIR